MINYNNNNKQIFTKSLLSCVAKCKKYCLMFFYASSRIVLMLTATAFLPKSFQTKVKSRTV